MQKAPPLVVCLLSVTLASYCFGQVVERLDSLALTTEASALKNYRTRLQSVDINKPHEQLLNIIAEEYKSITKALRSDRGCDSSQKAETIYATWYTAMWASFYTAQQPYYTAIRTCFDLLSERKLLTPFVIEYTYKTFVYHRALDEARNLALAYSDMKLEPLPEVIDVHQSAPSVIKIKKTPDLVLERHALNVDTGYHILVVASTGCQFSHEAVKMIKSNPELHSALSRAYWIAPPNELSRTQDILQWNQVNEFAQLAIAYDYAEFSDIGLSLRETPVFYLIQDGTIIEKFVGWTETTQLQLASHIIAEYQ